MDSMILTFTFAAAVAIAACVVLLFSESIDMALVRVVPAELVSAWRRYVKFALFTVTFAGGMRLTELAEFIAMRAPAGPPLTAAQSLLEILKTLKGSLIAASVTLLAFFAATLAMYAAILLYQMRPTGIDKAEASRSRPGAADRQPVGSERHAAGKDRQRIDESGRYL